MSASERLRALDRAATGDRVIPVFRKTGSKVLGFDAFTRAEDLEALRNALPLIADVVEAAEAASSYVTDARDSLDEDEMEDGEPSITAARLMAAEMRLAPALIALRERLEGQ